MTVALPGGDVAVCRWPGPPGAPELHWAHANGFNALTYRTLLAPLREHVSVVASDLRGHGLTRLPADPASHLAWSGYGRDLAQVLLALGPRPRLLAGHSMGAIASLLAADERPELCAGLVMVEPVVLSDWRRLQTRVLRGLGLLDRLVPLIAGARRRRSVFPGKPEAIAAYRGRGAFRTWSEQALADYVEDGFHAAGDGTVRLACSPEWEAANFSLGPPAIWPAVARLKAPATMLYGTHHSTVGPVVARTLRRLKPQMRSILVPQASHFLPMEAPELIRGEILQMAAAAIRSR